MRAATGTSATCKAATASRSTTCGSRSRQRIDPGDILVVAKHKYRVEYDPVELGAVGPPPADNLSQEIMSESLLSRAGLDHREIGRAAADADDPDERYDPTNMKAGQIELPDDPV